jgi:ABC-type proline/glycine betaine transport system permease subunit
MNKKNLIKKLYNGNKLNFVVLTILSLLSTIPSMVISIMLERIISIAYEKDLQALIDQGTIFLILMAALVLGYIINIYIKPKYKKKAMSQYKQNIYIRST